MADEPELPSERTFASVSVVFYGIMTAVGFALISAQDATWREVVFGTGENGLRDTLLGAGSGLAVVALSWATRNLPFARRLNDELGAVLGSPSTPIIAVLAVTSAIGEEVLFRGGLQPLIGFWPTVFVFGIIHGGTSSRLRAWAVFATLAGVLLGWLTLFTGNLLAAILCHLTVNYWNLHGLADHTPDPPQGSGRRPPWDAE